MNCKVGLHFEQQIGVPELYALALYQFCNILDYFFFGSCYYCVAEQFRNLKFGMDISLI